MKNDIDSLLEAMFRSGKLNLKPGEKKAFPEQHEAGDGVPTLQWDPAENSAQAQKNLQAVQNLNAVMNQNLQKSIADLTKSANEDLSDLERRLKADGVQEPPAKNGGGPKDLDAAFEKAQKEAGERVLGQEEFLRALTVAFKRPFVAGGDGPLGRILVQGKRGTGRHTALEALAGSLGRQGVLKSPKLCTVDLSRYGEAGSEKLFLQDLYAGLKSGACGLVFENFQECHPTVLPLISSLFREGIVPLSSRYAEQKGMLVDVGSALVPGAVSELSGAGKYLFLLTDRSEAKLADAFGAPFLASLTDICGTSPLSPEALSAIGKRILTDLCERSKSKLQFPLTYDGQAEKALLDQFDPETGAVSLEEAAEKLYDLLSEEKLRGVLPQGASGVATGIDDAGASNTLAIRVGEALLTVRASAGDAAREAAVKAVKEELDEIVGLQDVKEYILSLEDNFKIQQLRRERGLKTESPSMHMIFTGNPGTGKTTMARIVSRYLKAIGVLTGGQLIEVTRADLVGKYVGHTAPLTSQAIQSALGGVLFVDEAYSLYRGKDDSFGLEAIDTLVKGMEDHRDELVVILAGYSYEMEEFLTANSGLRSRFPNIIEFADYTAAELLDITKSIVKGKGYRLDPACDAPLLTYYEKQQSEGDPRTNGNGRMARNKVEDAILNCSRRNLRAPEAERDLELLKPEDFEV